MEIHTAKAVARRRYLSARAKFKFRSGERASRALNANLSLVLESLGAPHVAIYAACGGEAVPAPEGVASPYYPRVVGSELEFYKNPGSGRMARSRLGVREPVADARARLNPRAAAVICCPAVAADWSGTRLGRGRGFYDRFFKRHPRLIRVGVLFQIQMSPDPLPADRGDEPLDWIVTEHMILRPPTGRNE